MSRTFMTAEEIEITMTRPSELKTVRVLARQARRMGVPLIVIVAYDPPPARQLERWRNIVPEEFRWRIHGSTVAEELARDAERIGAEVGVEVRTECRLADN